jgi:cyclopropane-fatty-acyl-phospholipid synthase
MSLASSSSSSDDSSARRRRHPRVVTRLVDWALPVLQAGRLLLILPNGEAILRHGNEAGPEATLAVHHWRALWRILLDGDHGFADGYLDGDWSTPELSQLLELFMRNESAFTPQAVGGWLSLARHRLLHWWRANTRRGSRRNIAAHYNLGNDFFMPWLDGGMNYSSALFAGDDTLEAAQKRKLDRAASLLDLSGG